MKNLFLLLLFISGAASLRAQSMAKQKPNLKITYLAGVQMLNLDHYNNIAENRLSYNTPYKGFVTKNTSLPVLMQSLRFSVSVFKNKKWFLDVEAGYGYNSARFYFYSADYYGNPLQVKEKATRAVFALGYGFSREINMRKWGTLMPKLCFNFSGLEIFHDEQVTTTITDKSSGQIISRYTDDRGFSISNITHVGALMLFDSPKIGIDWNIGFYKNFAFTLSYSYWLGGGMINNLYGISKNFIIPPADSILKPPGTRYFSHNISLGLAYKLFR